VAFYALFQAVDKRRNARRPVREIREPTAKDYDHKIETRKEKKNRDTVEERREKNDDDRLMTCEAGERSLDC
jgi:hypothetical protein